MNPLDLLTGDVVDVTIRGEVIDVLDRHIGLAVSGVEGWTNVPFVDDLSRPFPEFRVRLASKPFTVDEIMATVTPFEALAIAAELTDCATEALRAAAEVRTQPGRDYFPELLVPAVDGDL